VVRLGTCIALELVCAVGAAAGVWVVAGHGVQIAGEYLQPEASAAAASPSTVTRLPSARLEVGTPIGDTTVFEQPDDQLLAPLAATPVTGIKLNHGGTSLSLRLTFASGARAAFKPMQIHPQSDPRREIAAYRIDRLLGIGHVPPAKPGRFKLSELVAAVEPTARDTTAQRFAEESLPQNGVLQGELSWWIPEIRDATIHDEQGAVHRVDELAGFATWLNYLQSGATIPDDVRPMVEQLAAVVLFDILIDNADRWTGNNTKCSVDNKTLYFMDNTLAFSTFTLGHEANLAPLRRMEVFPRALVARLRELTYDTVARAVDVGDDPIGPLLNPAEIRALLARRDHLVRFIDDDIADLGEKKALALP
jgi:hypothetical protein